MPWEPATEFNPNDALVTTTQRLVELLQHFLDEDVNAEGAVVTRGFPNIQGELPLNNPRVTIYPMPGGGMTSPGYDDSYGKYVSEDDGQTYNRTGVDHEYNFYIDVYTSQGSEDRPSPSGGMVVRDRLQSKIMTLFSRDDHTLPEEILVTDIKLGISTAPANSQELDICMARLMLEVSVPIYVDH